MTSNKVCAPNKTNFKYTFLYTYDYRKKSIKNINERYIL